MNEERSQEGRGGNENWRVETPAKSQPDVDEIRPETEDIAGDLDHWLRTFVRERPFVTVAAAVAAGFFVGRLLSRR